MRDACLEQLVKLAEQDDRIFLITGDLGFKVLDEYIDRCPKQFLNAGVAEQNMTGLAVGLALEGRTVFTYSIANFPSLRCLEQIRNDACYHDANVNVVSVGAGFSYGQLGISHHATEDVTIMRSLPNITICSPGCDWEAQMATAELARTPGTGYLRLDRSSAGNTQKPNETFEIGKARVLRAGSDILLATTGGILANVLIAADKLAQSGITSTVMQFPTIKPLDVASLTHWVPKTQGLVVVEEHSIEGGLGGMIAENLLELGCLPGFFQRMGLPSCFSSVVGSQEYLRSEYGLGADHIVETVMAKLNKNGSASSHSDTKTFAV